MRLLIVTQKVDHNDDVLGFFHRWIIEFSKRTTEVTVIALQVGPHTLPSNVRVYSLGKEYGAGKMKRLWNLFYYAWRERNRYDAVFVHMNPEYVVLCGWMWKALRKRIVLWYTHRQDNTWIRNAEPVADIIVTASVKSFPFQSRKVHVIGHGIDVSLFACESPPVFGDPIEILTVGRITRIKQYEVLLEAMAQLRAHNSRVHATIVGAPITHDDKGYLAELYKKSAECKLGDSVAFIGSVPNKDITPYYCRADVVVNMTPTGGIDKTVLEGMAASRIPVVSNTAFEEYFGTYAKDLIFKEGDAGDLARKIKAIIENSNRRDIINHLQRVAIERCDVSTIVGAITQRLNT